MSIVRQSKGLWVWLLTHFMVHHNIGNNALYLGHVFASYPRTPYDVLFCRIVSLTAIMIDSKSVKPQVNQMWSGGQTGCCTSGLQNVWLILFNLDIFFNAFESVLMCVYLLLGEYIQCNSWNLTVWKHCCIFSFLWGFHKINSYVWLYLLASSNFLLQKSSTFYVLWERVALRSHL